jgi:hypothetical protein
MDKFGLESKFHNEYEGKVRRADKIIAWASMVILVAIIFGVLQ